LADVGAGVGAAGVAGGTVVCDQALGTPPVPAVPLSLYAAKEVIPGDASATDLVISVIACRYLYSKEIKRPIAVLESPSDVWALPV